VAVTLGEKSKEKGGKTQMMRKEERRKRSRQT